MGLAFSGEVDPDLAIQASAPVYGNLVGDKWIAIGGGKGSKAFSNQNLGQLTAAINQGKFAAYHGIAFDVEECASNGLEGAFGQAMGAAKGKGLAVLVTTSHAAPYGCGDAQTLMRSFFNSPNVNIISPQLYTTGSESAPDFNTGNKGIQWWEYGHTKAAIVPSVVSASQYGSVKWQFGQWGIHAAGYLQWKGTPLPPPAPGPAPSPSVHGTYIVQSGDTCHDISQKLCGVGKYDDAWQKTICDGVNKCALLQIGEKLKYDCSETGKYCGDGNTDGFILI